MNNVIKKISALILAGTVSFGCCSVNTFARPLDTILAETEGLDEYLRQLTTDMAARTLKSEYIQEQIDEVNTRISDNEALLADAKAAAEVQYDAMKKRIVYLYESGDTNYLEALFSSESISDILNKFEYIDKIVGYDREMLEKYYEVMTTIETLQNELVEKRNELETLKQESIDNLNAATEAASTASSEIIQELGVDSEEADSVISDYINEYGDEIRQELEQEINDRQEADPEYNWYEDESVWETTTVPEETQPSTEYVEPVKDTTTEYVEPETETTTEYVEPETETTTEYVEPETETTTEYEEPDDDYSSDYIDDTGFSDAYLIACLVSGECGYVSYEGQWAVADVIVNRLESGYWSGSIYGILHEPGQFDAVNWYYIPGTSVPSYLYYIQNGPLDISMQAANDALYNRGKSHGYQFYCNYWFYEAYPDLFVNTYGEEILDGWFYNYIW